MKNRIVVRTDLINPHIYLDIELGYKELLEILYKCGGYALYQQIYKYFKGRSKGYREVKKLEDLLLVGSEQFNNNKYIYLKITALKYLLYRDIEDISNISINRNIVKPSYRPLMNSIYSFEYYLYSEQIINTELSNQVLSNVIEKIKGVLKINRIPNIHLVRVEKEEFSNRLETKLKILGDRNGIYLKNFQEVQELSKSILNFVWFDFDQETEENTALKTIRLISRFINSFGTKNQLNSCQFSLEIVTLSEDKKQVLEKLVNRAISSIEKKNEYFLKNQNKTQEVKVISGLTKVDYTVLPDIEGYVKLSSKGDSEFSFVDDKTVDRLQELREVLKGGNDDE